MKFNYKKSNNGFGSDEWLQSHRVGSILFGIFILGPIFGLFAWLATMIGLGIFAGILFIIGTVLCLTIIGILLGGVVLALAVFLVSSIGWFYTHWIVCLIVGMAIGFIFGLFPKHLQKVKSPVKQNVVASTAK